MKMQILKLLLKDDIITIEQVKEAASKANDADIDLTDALDELGILSESEFLDYLGNKFSVPVISIEDHSIDQDVIKLIPREMAIENKLMPLNITGSALTVAMSDPSNIIIADELSFLTEKNIIPVVVSERSIVSLLGEYYGYTERTKPASVFNSNNQSKDIQNLLNELDEFNNEESEQNEQILVEIDGTQEQSSEYNLSSETDIPPITYNQELDKDSDEENAENPQEINEVRNDPVIFNEQESETKETLPKSDLENSDLSDQNNFHTEPQEQENQTQMNNLIQTSISTLEDSEPEVEIEQVIENVEEVRVQTPIHEYQESEEELRVLVIDNSRTVQKLISLSLERSGYTVNSVSDGMEALSCLSSFKPNLIFIDINLQNMDGYRVCKVIKSHALMKRVPIVMLSGTDGLVDKMRSKMAGADGYITKPFDLNNIKDTANRFTEMASDRLVAG